MAVALVPLVVVVLLLVVVLDICGWGGCCGKWGPAGDEDEEDEDAMEDEDDTDAGCGPADGALAAWSEEMRTVAILTPLSELMVCSKSH